MNSQERGVTTENRVDMEARPSLCFTRRLVPAKHVWFHRQARIASKSMTHRKEQSHLTNHSQVLKAVDTIGN